MAYTLCAKVRDLQPYSPITGEYPVRLDANESFLPLPPAMQIAVQTAINGLALNRYPDPCATNACAAFAALHGLDAGLVTAGNGSDELISVILGGLLESGSSVITFTQDFSMYRFYTDIYQLRSVVLPKKEDLQLDFPATIAAAKAQKAAAILFSNPCNPTSLGEKRQDIITLLEALPQTLVIVDEAYMDFYHQSVLDLAPKYDNLIVLKTCSKAIGLAALRLGFAVCGKPLTHALQAVKSPYNVNLITQEIGAAVLQQKTALQAATTAILASRQELASGLEKLAAATPGIIKLFSSCTNFVFMQVQNAAEVFAKLKQKGIVVRQMGDYLRITAGTKDENTALLTALQAILQQ